MMGSEAGDPRQSLRTGEQHKMGEMKDNSPESYLKGFIFGDGGISNPLFDWTL